MLSSFAHRLYTHPVQRHLFFLALALATIGLIGYHFGTFDQFAHLPFLKKYADPTLYPNDAFIELRHENYSYFWRLFVPIQQAGLLAPTLMGVHLLATYATYWQLWALARRLFGDPAAAVLGCLAFVVPHVGFAGFPVFEFSLLNRTFVLPWALWAVNLYLAGRPLRAFLLLGVLYNLHVITVNFVLAMFLADLGLRLVQEVFGRTPNSPLVERVRTLVVGVVIFVLCALPVLFWRLTSPAAQAAHNPEWFDVMARGSLYNIFYLVAPYVHILFVTFSGLSTLALYALGQRWAPAQTPELDRTVRHFLLAVMVILTVQAVTVLVYPIDLLNQLQVIRAGMWATIFGYLYFAAALVRGRQGGRWPAGEWWVLTLTLLGSFLPFIPLLALGVQRLLRPGPARAVVSGMAAAGVMAYGLNVAMGLNLWGPGVYPAGPGTAWEQIQTCAREQTPKDALFITPPEKWWLYGSDWRTFSERSTLATHSELLMIALAPSHYDHWKERFVRLAPGAIEQFAGDFFANQRIVKAAFDSLSEAELLQVAADYQVDYIVLEQPHTLSLPALDCANAAYTIYRAP